MLDIARDFLLANGQLDVERIREDFPILHQEVNGKPFVYFDNAATTQKPIQVIEALTHYYLTDNSNIHRGIHTLAERATAAFEATRDKVKSFLNAAEREEIIFTRGTTESINLVAATWGNQYIEAGDEIVVSAMEHHSNMVPWHMLAQRKKAKVKIIPMNDAGELLLDNLENIITSKTKLVACVHVSNALGTINPIASLINAAKKVGAVTLIDGAQAVSHLDIDVQSLGADFYVFSGHKLYGPTGVGVLYGKRSLLEAMPPYQGGGEMISEVTYEGCTYNELPYKFEAGTPNIADVVALGSAIEYVLTIGKKNIRQHETILLDYATKKALEVPGLQCIGTAADKVGVLSFVFSDVHPQDIGILLDKSGIAIRTGHHCTQPLMGRLGIPGTSRMSFAVYNTIEEIDLAIEALYKALRLLR
ncbi:MAG: cysteine desulfurase [Cytophagaceae bacterium]|jgi:cysteine desulfurase/selenocysteine lyase|nr:cysteine desulfurase [Cytophagaceae bacterium]